jgi:hypothetical protein
VKAHPIAKEMEAWWKNHGGRPDDGEWIAYVNDFGSLLIDKLIEQSEEHDNEGRFGMSKAGGCTRAAGLKYLGHESELPGSVRATFAIGHQLEIMAIATLRACGYSVAGTQQRVTIDPYMSSSMDGVIVLDGKHMGLSVKSMGYKMSGKRWAKGGVNWTRHGFAAMTANGAQAEQPGHWAQAQAEMRAAGLSSTLYVVVAKDMVKAMEGDPVLINNGSLTFYAEVIEYDDAFARFTLQDVWADAWHAVQQGIAPAGYYYTKNGRWVALNPHDADGNKAATGTYDPCSYCDLRDACTVAAPLAESVKSMPMEVAL